MKIKALITAAILALASQTALAATITIDFDVDDDGATIAANTSITDQYADFGVTFFGLEDGNFVDINAAPDPDGEPMVSSPNALSNCDNASLSCPGNRADIINVTFDSVVSDVSLFINTLGFSGTGVDIQAYGEGNVFLENIVVDDTNAYEMVSFASSGILQLQLVQPEDGWAFAIDDLTFTTMVTSVSAPATLGLFCLGFAVFSMSRRTKS